MIALVKCCLSSERRFEPAPNGVRARSGSSAFDPLSESNFRTSDTHVTYRSGTGQIPLLFNWIGVMQYNQPEAHGILIIQDKQPFLMWLTTALDAERISWNVA